MNKDESRTLRARLPRAVASVLRLAGPALDAKTGVPLGGQAVGADGRWRSPAGVPGNGDRDASVVVLPPASGAVVLLK